MKEIKRCKEIKRYYLAPHRKEPLKIKGQEIQILQDLQLETIKKRKELGNLTLVLQQKNRRYQWKISSTLEIFLKKGKKIIKLEQAEKPLQELTVNDGSDYLGLSHKERETKKDKAKRKRREAN